MMPETRTQGVKQYSPDLCVQMAVCDANFIRLLKLLPEFEEGARREIVIPLKGSVSNPQQDKDGDELWFRLQVTESFRYTSTIQISQHHHDVSSHYQSPEIEVRAYHDANTAEVTRYQGVKNFKSRYTLPNVEMRHPDEKQQLNLFLGEWLSLCLSKGINKEKLSFNAADKTALTEADTSSVEV